jgi:hypothetical protein
MMPVHRGLDAGTSGHDAGQSGHDAGQSGMNMMTVNPS